MLHDLKQKLSAISGALDDWGVNTFGHVRSELKKLNDELERMRSDTQRTGPTHAEIKIRDKIVELNYREQDMWKEEYKEDNHLHSAIV